MKKSTHTLLAIILLVMAGCGGNSQSENDLITVDINASYSHKKELILQDFMDVEYIALETNDDFVNQGFVQDIGKEIILVKNRRDDGTIFVYDRSGKALRKINRKGQGDEEYTGILDIALDEDSNEMFINDHWTKKIKVYDLYGNFKRSFKHKEGNGSICYADIFNYDREHLICYDIFNKEIPFVLISKKDGNITQEIRIPFQEKKLLVQIMKDAATNTEIFVSPSPHRTIIPFKGDWLLVELSSDTVYSLLPDYTLRPFLIRTPAIKSMELKVFLSLRLFSDRYYFMETIKNEYDFDQKDGFPKTYFVYDRQKQIFFNYIIYNGDYTYKEEIYMSLLTPVNHEIESWYPIDAHRLIQPYKKGQLKGKLKEIAASLDEDSNPVIMLIKHKK